MFRRSFLRFLSILPLAGASIVTARSDPVRYGGIDLSRKMGASMVALSHEIHTMSPSPIMLAARMREIHDLRTQIDVLQDLLDVRGEEFRGTTQGNRAWDKEQWEWTQYKKFCDPILAERDPLIRRLQDLERAPIPKPRPMRLVNFRKYPGGAGGADIEYLMDDGTWQKSQDTPTSDPKVLRARQLWDAKYPHR